MKQFAPVNLRVERKVLIRMRRSLRGKGTLNVSLGQQVSPEEIIGTSTISSGFRILNLSTLLSVSPSEVENHLTRQIGQRIYKGELLASKKGFLLSGKKVVAPTDGILDFLNSKTGELRLSFIPKKVELPAGVYGIVEAVDREKGLVIIRTQVSRIHGMFGSGGPRDGILQILNAKDSLVSKTAIAAKYNEYVLVGRNLFFKEAITASISAGVRGIITGGLNAKDYKAMAGGRLIFPKKLDNDIGISIVVCEGFGSIPIGDDIFEILSEYEGRFVYVDGNKAQILLPSFESSSLTTVKNTQLPEFLDEESTPEEKELELKIGLKVRVVGSSFSGEQGKIVAINESETLLPSGLRAYLVTVEGSRRKIQVPVANCEVIL